MSIVVLNDTRDENHHGCSIVMSVLAYKIKEMGVSDIFFVPIGFDWQNSEEVKEKIISSRAVIVNGEGTIHHNSPSGEVLLKVASFAARFDVPSFLINCSYQGNSENYRQLLKYFTCVYVRESRSQLELKKIGIASSVVPDLTFANFPKAALSPPNTASGGGVYVTDSVLPKVTKHLKSYATANGFTLLDIFSKKGAPPKFKQRLILFISLPLKKKIVKLASFLSRVLQKKDSDCSVVSFPTFDGWIREIESASLIYCGRFHALTIAIKCMTPFCSLASNTHKVEGLLEDVGLNRNKRLFVCGDADNFSCVETLAYTEQEKELIRRYLVEASSKIDLMFEHIGKSI